MTCKCRRIYKDLNLEFLTKKDFVTRMQCKNAIIAHVRFAYFTHTGRFSRHVCDGVGFPGSTTCTKANRSCARPRWQLPRLLERSLRNCDPFTSASKFKKALPCASTHTLYNLQLLTHPMLQLISKTES